MNNVPDMLKRFLLMLLTVALLLCTSSGDMTNAASSTDSDVVYLSRDISAPGFHNMRYASPESTISISGVIYIQAAVSSGWPNTGASYRLDGNFTTFTGIFGPIDDAVVLSSCVFTVHGDNVPLLELHSSDNAVPQEFEVDVTGVHTLRISINITNYVFLHQSVYAIGNAALIRDEALIRLQTLRNSGYPYQQVFDNSWTDGSPDVFIYTADELAAIGGEHSADMTYILANDIALTGIWTPIEDFRGTLDGAGHVISGLNTAVNQNGQAAGLFGTINTGNVTIRQLGAETPRNRSVSAGVRFDNWGLESELKVYAGGLIGRVTGGNVTIDECYFVGNVNASTQQFSVVKAALSLVKLPIPKTYEVYTFIAECTTKALDIAFDFGIVSEKSHSYAGGLIGSVEGGATVTINNSYTRGRARAYAETTYSIINKSSFSNVGGLVGYIAPDSQVMLSVGDSYSTSNVVADVMRSQIDMMTVYPFGPLALFKPQNQHAGGLIGSDRGSRTATTGNNYRLSTQAVIGSRDRINTLGEPLSRLAMHDQMSFVGWDFANIWTIDVGELMEPALTYSDSFSILKGNEEALNFLIDKDSSLFDAVLVNDEMLVKNVHYTVESSSTRITLLPSFLDTLEDGFHTVSVSFTDGDYIEEQFVVIETMESEMPPVGNIYIGDTLVYSGGVRLVDDSFFEALADGRQSLRVELLDGRVIEEDIIVGEVNADGGEVAERNSLLGMIEDIPFFAQIRNHRQRSPILFSVAVLALIAFIVIIALFIKRRKLSRLLISQKVKPSKPTHRSLPTQRYCVKCGNERKKNTYFCIYCGTKFDTTNRQ